MSEQPSAPVLTPALTPAPVPAASPRARWWTILLGLLLLAAGGVAVHDLLVVRGTIHTDQLLTPVYDWIADVTYDWVLPAAIGCALVALILLVATLRPRARTHLSFGEDAALYARPVDVARMSTAAARQAGGVLRASTVATRKRITVTATTAAGDQAERNAVSAAVSEQVGHLAAMLDPEPAVVVKIVASTPGGDRR
ncbi:MAG: DUF6286 domain-containing protein [Corynebacterium variabile]|nr:DUF6286 domain-containing protein [Corynebacterium variabile]